MPLAAHRYLVAGLAAMAAVMLLPLLVVAIPPLTDLPNHISRLHILATLGDDPHLQSNYVASWAAIPNLVIDAIGIPLTQIMSPYAAGKTFAVLAFMTALGGMFALHYAVHRSLTPWSGLIFFVAYNQSFMYGLLNFHFGVGLGFALLAAWIMFEGRHSHLKLWLFPVGALAVYFCHLMAFGIYGLILAGCELGGLLRRRERRLGAVLCRIGAAASQFVLPLVLLILTGGTGTELDGATRYGSVLHKTVSLLAAFRVYIEPLDFVMILFVLVLLAYAGWKRALRFGPGLAIPLIAIAVLALATPSVVLSIFGVDQRFAVVAAMLLLSAARIELPLRGPATMLIAVGFALLVWRVADLTVTWRAFDAQFAELRAAATAMDRGASILPVQDDHHEPNRTTPLGSDAAYWHVASLAVVERSLFNPQTFTARHQPIKAHPDRAYIDCSACRPVTREALRVLVNPEISWEILELPYDGQYWFRHAADWPARFDYILVVDFGDHANPAPDILTPRHTGSFFVIYENRKRPRG